MLDTFGSPVLSDELWRAETTSGAVWRIVKAIWEPVGHKILSHLRFFLANLRVLLGIVHLRISTLRCSLHMTISSLQHLTISFCLHTFHASFSAIDFCACLQWLWSSFLVIFPTPSLCHVFRSLQAPSASEDYAESATSFDHNTFSLSFVSYFPAV